MYVAVARGGTVTDQLIMSSPDAVTWTTRTMPVSGSLRSIEYGNGIFLAINDNLSLILTSTDGITWTQLPDRSSIVNPDAYFYALKYGGGVFAAISTPTYSGSGLSARAVWSTDGINWNVQSIPSPDRMWGTFKGLAYGSTQDGFNGFYALAQYSRTLFGSGAPDSQQTLLLRAAIS